MSATPSEFRSESHENQGAHHVPPAHGATRTPHWHHTHQSEPRWPVNAVVLLVIALQYTLPHSLNNAYHLPIVVIELGLLIAINVLDPKTITAHESWPRNLSLGLAGIMNAANLFSTGRLIKELIDGGVTDAGSLLLSGGSIWLTNVVVFALWYWEFDRGGPAARSKAHKQSPDFMFPQMSDPDLAAPDWASTFFDYLYVSFTNSTAFSPTDVLPLTRWAKVLMMLQSGTSLIAVALVIARAVNILN